MALVFQEEATPFVPDMIASNFLHSFVLVQVEEPRSANTRYKVINASPPVLHVPGVLRSTGSEDAGLHLHLIEVVR